MYSRPQLQATIAASNGVAPMHADDLRCSGVTEDLKRTSGALDVLEPRVRRTHAPQSAKVPKVRSRALKRGLLLGPEFPKFSLDRFQNFGALRPRLLG